MGDDPNIVDWDENDPENPMNWPKSKKWFVTTVWSTLTFCVTFASSVFSSATDATAKEFHVSDEVMVLGSSLFVLGFALGPTFWGPLSEVYGRKAPLFAGFFISAIFQIPVAVAQNVETVLICRFLGGVFGCSPIAVIGGALADFWDAVDRGVAVCTFAGATFVGPLAGPIAGSFITGSYLGWRWVEWLTLILMAFFGTFAVIVVPETSAPILLSRRAKKIRYETQNWAIHAKYDEQQVDIKAIVVKYFFRPIKMLFLEPILLLMTIYLAFVYGILYLWFFSYPVAFQTHRGWSAGLASLPFIAIIIGILLGAGFIIWYTLTRYVTQLRTHGKLAPEERLPPMIVGAVLLPVGLFWFAWTSNKSIPWPSQVVAGIPTGAGVLIIFIQGFNYIIDVYLMTANSALAGNALVRSLLGAAFPLFANALYSGLGVPWATSTLGFISVALAPVPVLFFFYGKKIRSWSKMSMNKT
ncbi:MFS general substrate transporter [Xylaria venustula]|nr:MFS general substrate transporter [Xylaria venustula]